MQTLSQIRQLLEAHGLKPRHRLGQNFLHDQNQIIKLVDAAEIKPGELVLEIGPGTGTLTEALLGRGAEVIACEIDSELAEIIADVFAIQIAEGETRGRGRPGSLTLIRGDALAKHRHLNPEVIDAIAGRPFKLVANLPYQVASPIMTALLTDFENCVGQFVTIQKEVADRLMAKPSTKEYGALTIIVQAMAEVKRIGVLSPSCFWPQPEVTSAMVAILPSPSGRGVGGEGGRATDELRLPIACRAAGPHPDPLPEGEWVELSKTESRREFARFIIDLFSKRRKQLGTILGRNHINWPEGVTADLRPEALTVEQLIALHSILNKSD